MKQINICEKKNQCWEYLKCTKNTDLLRFEIREPRPHETCLELPKLKTANDSCPSAKYENGASQAHMDLPNMNS
jgi:hypothetical protein